MKLKYEWIINHIARLLCEGKTKEAEAAAALEEFGTTWY